MFTNQARFLLIRAKGKIAKSNLEVALELRYVISCRWRYIHNKKGQKGKSTVSVMGGQRLRLHHSVVYALI